MKIFRPAPLRRLILVAGLLPAAVVIGDRAYFKLSGRAIRANETTAIQTLRELGSLQSRFRQFDLDNDNVLDYADCLTELSQAGLIDATMVTEGAAGYRFSISASTFDWQCSATPLSRRTGRRNFIICTDGVVRISGSGQATCSAICLQ